MTHRNKRQTTARAIYATLAIGLVVAATGCDQAPQDAVEHAEFLLSMNEVAEAIELLERSLEDSPNDHSLNRMYGMVLLETGQPAEAIWPLDKASKLPQAGPEDLLLLAQAHLAGGSATDAISTIDGMLDQSPDILEAYQLRVNANRSLNRPEQALADVEYVLSLRPDEASMLVERASLLLELDRPTEAKEAIAAAREMMLDPYAPENWAARFCAIDASFLFESGGEGHTERARDAWESCLSEHPGDEFVTREAIDFFDGVGARARSLDILRAAVEATPNAPGLRVSYAQRLAATGDLDAAEHELLAAVDGPGGTIARPSLVAFYSELGDYAKARSAIEEMMALMPSPPADVRILHADILIRGGEFAAAEEAIDSLDRPEHKSLLRGRLALEQGNAQRALDLLEQGVQLWPTNAVGRILMAQAAERLGDIDRAIDEYIAALRSDPGNWEALESLARLSKPTRRANPLGQVLNQYLTQHPQDARAYRLMFDLGVWSGNPGRVRAATLALQRIPGQQATVVALVAKRRGRNDPVATVDFIEGTQMDLSSPANAEALHALVGALSELSRHDEALARTAAALDAHPDVADFHVLHAQALTASDAPYLESRRSYARALELAPNDKEALIGLGRLEARENDLDAALDAFDRATNEDPTDATAGWYAIQAIVAADDRMTQLDARLATLLSHNVEHAAANELVARRIADQHGDLLAADRAATRAVRLGGGPGALVTLGRIARLQGDLDRAVGLLQRALEAEPESSTARYQLGVTFARAGDAASARRELERALQSENFPHADAARAELAALDR